MAGGKLSPRQKMINMMYLVLTALLALNVSKEILKSFHMFENSFITAASNYDEKDALVMKAFQASLEKDPVKTKPYLKRAEEATKISNDFNKYISDMKETISKMNGGRKEIVEGQAVGELIAPDQMEKHANYFMAKNIGGRGHGAELIKMINDTREGLLNLLKSDNAKGVKLEESFFNLAKAETQLYAKAPESKGVGPKKTWESAYLEHNPQAGVMALLSKIQNDAKALKSNVIANLQTGITASDFTFDKLEAKIIAPSSYVMTNTPYEAEVLLVASNSTSDHKIMIDGSEKPLDIVGGIGKYSATHGSVGVHTVSGNIIVEENGEPKKYPFSAEYQTFQPAATISADKMNVLYVGLQNPISVSVPGFPASEVTASISGGWKLSGKNKNTYMATAGGNAREVTVTAMAKGKLMGKQVYRIRPVPTPRAVLGNLDGSRPVTIGQIKQQRTVYASLGQGFAFDGIKFNVTSFTVVVSTRKGTLMKNFTGSSFSQATGMLGGLRRGDQVIITQIKCTGPGGAKSIPGIVIPVQ